MYKAEKNTKKTKAAEPQQESYYAHIESKRSAKWNIYQRDLEENQKYEDNSDYNTFWHLHYVLVIDLFIFAQT